MFYFLPIDLKLKIWSYDDTCKINYNKCIEEINKKYKKSIYFQQSPYKTIMYFEPTLEELNKCFKNLHKNELIFDFENTFILNEITINQEYNICYLSKICYYYKKENFFKKYNI